MNLGPFISESAGLSPMLRDQCPDLGAVAQGAGPPVAGSVYPVRLSDGAVSHDAFAWYLRWADWLGLRTAADREPWLPVGHVGPALVLGHSRPGLLKPPLPPPCFQPVLLTEEDYGRLHAHCLESLAAAGRPCWDDGTLVAPRSMFPERFILPGSRLAAAQFMIEYFPHEREDWVRLKDWIASAPDAGAPLPQPYEGAAWLLMRRGPVGDLCGLRERVPEGLTLPVEGDAATPYRVVAWAGRTLWIGCPSLPQPRLEDQLLDAVGDGWQLRFVLAPAVAVPSGADADFSAPRTPHGPRARLSIDTPSAFPSAHAAGVIRLSEREIGELERYDPRRSDRDPVKVFLRELSAAIRCGASDLHLEPGLDRARVRARVDGLMEEWLEMNAEFGQAVVGAAKELIGLPAERFVPQDGGCTVHHGGETVSVRVSCYPIRRRRQKLALRFLPRRGCVPSLAEIMPAREAGMLLHAATRPYGLILVCGPTGSGKTTTVFSTLSSINTAEKNITTMEDPIEYELEGVNQAELDPHRGVGWEVLLKGFLRQDPDAGMLGEIRDRPTAETAVRQALTGHVVFATLHTMSCARTLERLIDMGINADSLASALSLVASQRLVRRLCRRCRVRRSPSDDEAALFRSRGLPVPDDLWAPTPGGCPSCRGGYSGRLAAVEMLPVVDEVARMIERRARAREFAEWASACGLSDVFGAALGLAARGETSMEEAAEWRPVWEDFAWRP